MDRFLSDDERDRLTAIASIVRFKKGAKIYQEGDRTNEVFCIISGVVKTYKAPPDESEHITAFLFRDDVFGLSEEGRYTNSAKAIAEVTAYRLPISALRNRLLSDADLGWHVIRKLHQDLGQAQRHSFILTRKHALSRLAMFLQLLEHLQAARREPTSEIYLPMNRSDIAHYVGMSLAAVSRGFRSLSARGIMSSRDRRHVKIIDRNTFEKVAGGRW